MLWSDCSHSPDVLHPNLQSDVVRNEAFGKELAHKGRVFVNGMHTFTRDPKEQAHPSSYETMMEGIISELGNKPSPDIESANALILDFQEISFHCKQKVPSLWCFIIASQMHQETFRCSPRCFSAPTLRPLSLNPDKMTIPASPCHPILQIQGVVLTT